MLSDILTIARGQLTLVCFIGQNDPFQTFYQKTNSRLLVHPLLLCTAYFPYNGLDILFVFITGEMKTNLERILKSKLNYFPTCPWFYTCRDLLSHAYQLRSWIWYLWGTKRRKGFTAFRNEFATTVQEHPVVKWEMPRFVKYCTAEIFYRTAEPSPRLYTNIFALLGC
jgi:hypothetical protein